MAGNIGATLDDAWVTGRDRDEVDDDDDEQAQFSEYPFAVGLLDGHNRPDELSLNEKPESSWPHLCDTPDIGQILLSARHDNC